jgi:hypothetical protein
MKLYLVQHGETKSDMVNGTGRRRYRSFKERGLRSEGKDFYIAYCCSGGIIGQHCGLFSDIDRITKIDGLELI